MIVLKTPGELLGNIYSDSGQVMSFNKTSTNFEFYNGISKDNGDSWAVAYILCNFLFDKYSKLPQGEKPTNWSVTKPNIQGTNIDEGRQQFIFSFSVEISPSALGTLTDTQGT